MGQQSRALERRDTGHRRVGKSQAAGMNSKHDASVRTVYYMFRRSAVQSVSLSIWGASQGDPLPSPFAVSVRRRAHARYTSSKTTTGREEYAIARKKV